MSTFLRTPLSQSDLERAKRFPPRLMTQNRKFLAWRLLVKDSFLARLKPRSISFIATRIETSYAKARMLCELHGWTCLPRRAATDVQLWVPPINEQFAETNF